MDDTENYLNSIIQKRAGSISNPYATKSRLPNRPGNNKPQQGLTRVPVVHEKVEDTPTIFKKKMDSIFINNPYSSASHNNLSQIGRGNQRGSIIANIQSPHNRSSSQQKQRVEYMLITKRIQQRQDQQDRPDVNYSQVPTSSNSQMPNIPRPNASRHNQANPASQYQPVVLVEKKPEPTYTYNYESNYYKPQNSASVIQLQPVESRPYNFGTGNSLKPVSTPSIPQQDLSGLVPFPSDVMLSSKHTPINDLRSSYHSNFPVLQERPQFPQVQQNILANTSRSSISFSPNNEAIQIIPQPDQRASQASYRGSPDQPNPNLRILPSHPKPQVVVQSIQVQPVPPSKQGPASPVAPRRRRKIFEKD